MQVLETIAAMRRACQRARFAHVGPDRLGLVPTMGALHAGHRSLLQRARADGGVVAASIFVNPLQFGQGEDYEQYPRDKEQDFATLEEEGVDLLFMPSVEEMYPGSVRAEGERAEGGQTGVAKTVVEVQETGERLDGAHRPGHFRGVATVVAKLFHIVAPERAYFGQKDAVQVAVLRQMVRDLNFDVELVSCATVRDVDGLALSSRNKYLSAAERKQALALPRALAAMQEAIGDGVREKTAVVRAGMEVLKREPGVRLEFLETVHAETLAEVRMVTPGTLVALAAKVGRTRLIDNFLAE